MTLGGIVRPNIWYARKRGLNIYRKQKRIMIDQECLFDCIDVEPAGDFYTVKGMLHIGDYRAIVVYTHPNPANVRELKETVKLEGLISMYRDYLLVPTVAIGFNHNMEHVVLRKGAKHYSLQEVYDRLVKIVQKEVL